MIKFFDPINDIDRIDLNQIFRNIWEGIKNEEIEFLFMKIESAFFTATYNVTESFKSI